MRLRIFACALALAAPLAIPTLFGAGCSLPSSDVDGGDLHGVFDRDAAAADAAATDAGAKNAGRKDGGAAPVPVMTASAAAKPVTRPPTEGSCVAVDGLPDRDIKRTIGRPPCPGAEVLEWKDAAGAPRYACVITPKGIETRAPVPLLVFFHDAGDNPRSVDKETSLRKLAARFDLTGDPAHAGFIVVAPQGRALHGNREGAMFDIDYTGEDNVDVATADHFVSVLTTRGHVDRRRIYAVGAGHGGHMAATYAMMRADRIAAFATYGSDAPRAAWSCPGPPPPAFVMYRACDQIAPCASVERWLRARDAIAAETTGMRLGAANGEEPSCAIDKKCTKIVGTALHRRWPKGREEDLLRFLSRHTLSVAP
ncbi:hypothetical protein KEG38_41180 [Polyangium jinanense]|uniref:alpha/beta hydrolase family esterase n=1 Tax=Polyangium jinanense TaxID=2829994 RepID=UPI00234071A4|nr:hypothetical protein [Polyangium jinanense]MDC3960339.1 hypothetical protein [Polyangium jinanense]